MAIILFAPLSLAGCAATSARGVWPRGLVDAATPLLALDPDANWTECYNRLLTFGGAGVDYVVSRPAMTDRCPPDSLETLAATSLAQLVIGRGAPPLSGTCFETSYDLLHFDVKSHGTPVGEVRIMLGRPPRSWLALYPGRFDQEAAGRIDIDGDRRRIREWWLAQRGRGEARVAGRRLAPSVARALALLGRRYADRWGYAPDRGVIQRVGWIAEPADGKVERWEGEKIDWASSVPAFPHSHPHTFPPPHFPTRLADDAPAMFFEPTADYNLVRAACLWLADQPDAEALLIERVGSHSEIVAHNARFALAHSRDPGIRAAVGRYNRSSQ